MAMQVRETTSVHEVDFAPLLVIGFATPFRSECFEFKDVMGHPADHATPHSRIHQLPFRLELLVVQVLERCPLATCQLLQYECSTQPAIHASGTFLFGLFPCSG